jgi:hypothetical protein
MSIKTILGVIFCVLLVFGIYRLIRMFILKRAGDRISTSNVINGIYENGVISMMYYTWDKISLYYYDSYDQNEFIVYEFFPNNYKNEIKVKINRKDIPKINDFLFRKDIHFNDKQH